MYRMGVDGRKTEKEREISFRRKENGKSCVFFFTLTFSNQISLFLTCIEKRRSTGPREAVLVLGVRTSDPVRGGSWVAAAAWGRERKRDASEEKKESLLARLWEGKRGMLVKGKG